MILAAGAASYVMSSTSFAERLVDQMVEADPRVAKSLQVYAEQARALNSGPLQNWLGMPTAMERLERIGAQRSDIPIWILNNKEE
jgi:hypothetical protein